MMKNKWLLLGLAVGMAAVMVSCGRSSEEDAPKSSGDSAGYVQDGQEYLEEGNLEKAAESFRKAMAEDPKNMDARLGAAEVQIEREAYSMASDSLAMALRVDPTEREVYEMFLTLAEKADSISYARTAVNLAEQYDQQWFLDEYVPESAEASPAAGSCGEDTYVTLTAPEGMQIYYSLEGENNTIYEREYKSPIRIPRGISTLSFYTVKDHIPGTVVEYEYQCEYPEHAVTFADPTIEAIARAHLGKEGALTNYDCEKVQYLEYYEVDDWYDNTELYQVKTLEDLRMMPYCTTLYLQNQKNLPDLSVLGDTSISILELQSCNIADLGFVKNLPQLDYLYLQNNNITDISPAADLPNLRGLYLDDNPIADYSPLLKMKNLTDVGVSASENFDIGVFRGMENLTELNINGRGTLAMDCSALADLKQLQYLFLTSMGLSDISFVREMTKLTTLGLQNNEITDISPLEGLTNLESLYLERNSITDLSPLQNMKNLSQLDLDYNETLTDISALNHLPALGRLYLRRSEVPNEQIEDFKKSHPTCTVYN